VLNDYKELKKIFSTSGVVVPRETLRRNFKKYTHESGVQEIRLHDLRLTCIILVKQWSRHICSLRKIRS